MTIKPTPKRTFIFTEEEFTTMNMQRFQQEVATIRALPANEKNKLLGRYIIYPQVLTGELSYTKILADAQMRKFMKVVNAIFPEWLFYLHATNQFSPVHLYSQLSSLTIVEGSPVGRNRIVSLRTEILLVLLDAYASASLVADECETQQKKFMTHIRRTFSIANFELSFMTDYLIPDQRKPRRIIVISEDDLEGKGIDKVRQIFSRADLKRDRAAFGLAMLPDIEGELPVFYHDNVTRFLAKIWIEVPESIYFLRANAPGLLSVITSALQLKALRDDSCTLQQYLAVGQDDVVRAVLKNFCRLRQMDIQAEVSQDSTIAHLEDIFAGFGISFCTPKEIL